MNDTRTSERQQMIHDAIHYGYHDGTWGSDLRTLCELGADYVGNSIHSDTWFMALLDRGIDEIGNPVREAEDTSSERETGGVFHFLASRNCLYRPKRGVRGKSIKINPATPGINLYYLPQIMKRGYVSPKKYYGQISEQDRYKYRTKPQKWQNDWKRSEIYGEMAVAKRNHEKYGTPYSKAEFDRRIAATHERDVENPPCGKTGYTAGDILAYRDIVIDIDGHDIPDVWAQQLSDRLADILLNGCGENGKQVARILPNVIVKTGRGLQLHFLFKPVSFKAATMVRTVASTLCDEYDRLLLDHADELKIDRASSTDISGFKRLPGSYNWSATAQNRNGYGYKVTKHVAKTRGEEPSTIEDMMHALGIRVYSKDERERYYSRKNDIDRRESSLKRSGWSRKACDNGARARKLISLIKQHASNVSAGCRNDFLFIAGTVASEAGVDVLSFLSELNGNISEPLSGREVAKTARSAGSGRYHYAISTISERLGITSEELTSCGLTAGGGVWVSNVEKTRQRREMKGRRDLAIRERLENGESISAIARALNVCRDTVRNIKKVIDNEIRKAREEYEAEIARLKTRNQHNKTMLKKHIDRSVAMAKSTDAKPYYTSMDAAFQRNAVMIS